MVKDKPIVFPDWDKILEELNARKTGNLPKPPPKPIVIVV